MKPVKHLKLLSIATIVLGIIHVIATPIVIGQLKMLNTITLLCIAYMFVATGIGVIAIGWLQYFTLRRIDMHASFTAILKGSVLLMAVLGIGAVATMWGNPFAYITLLIALYELYLLKFLHVPTEVH